MDYLKDKQEYIDRYDLLTIKDCLQKIDISKKAYIEGKKKESINDPSSKGEWAKASNWYTNQLLFLAKAEAYRNKEETIQKWINDDQLKQEKYDTTPEPQGIRCPNCKKLMHVSTKHLETLEDPLRMMFLFECSSCNKRRWIYEDGTERKSTPNLCPKCNAEAKMTIVKEGNDKVIWKTTCSSCSFTKTEVDDFKKSRIEREKEEEEDKKLLENCREEFCSEENGKEALEYIDSFPVAEEVYNEQLKKYDSLAFQKVTQMNRLNITDLEKLLAETLEKEQYIKLSFEKPEIGQHVILSFDVLDNDSSRKQNISISHLQELIKEVLDGTNWRLMSDGISYRLGFLSGRLKGYEREEDFLEISGEIKEEPKQSKIDPETRMKYEGYHVIQLARLMGEFNGIENMRKRRLKKEPDGFFLESTEGPYTCGICGETASGDRIWWNLDGLTCADCHRNIKEKVIPDLKHGYDKDSNWFQNWQLKSESDFNIKPPTVRKLRNEGLLHGRDLKREDGTVYFTVYLIDENKEFLEKYPRKKRSGMIITDILGEKVEI